MVSVGLKVNIPDIVKPGILSKIIFEFYKAESFPCLETGLILIVLFVFI